MIIRFFQRKHPLQCGEIMKNNVLFTTILQVLILVISESLCWSQTPSPLISETTITIAGSGVNLGVTRLLAQAFTQKNPKAIINIPGSIGSKGAIKAIKDGAIQLGLISRPLSDQEIALGIGTKVYAQVAMVIGTNISITAPTISSQELIDIFKGTKTHWPNGEEIIVLAREKSDSGFAVLEQNIPGFKEVYQQSQALKRWTTYFTDQDANQALERTPGAIGVTDLGMINTENLRVNIAKLDGVMPSPGNLENGTYPLSRKLLFIYNKNTFSEETKAFLDFVFSEEGQDILKSNGYLPINE